MTRPKESATISVREWGNFSLPEPSRRKVPVMFQRTIKAHPANPATFRKPLSLDNPVSDEKFLSR
jgi:hypothetical protein